MSATAGRDVLVHAHMFKNAGTTLDWSLQRSLGEGFVDHREDMAMHGGEAYLGPWLREHDYCRAISSHWVGLPLPELPDTRLHLCVLLRDPVERIGSVYRFERQQEGVDTPGARNAKKMDFCDYLRWRLEPRTSPVLRDYHVRRCSGAFRSNSRSNSRSHERGDKPGNTGSDERGDEYGDNLAAMYQRAVELLEGAAAFGLVHRYDESMVLFEHRLRSHFPDLDLAYVPQNVLAEPDSTPAGRRRDVLEQMGDLREQVLAANRWDLRLFEYAERRFDVLLQEIPDLDARLHELSNRNAAFAAR